MNKQVKEQMSDHDFQEKRPKPQPAFSWEQVPMCMSACWPFSSTLVLLAALFVHVVIPSNSTKKGRDPRARVTDWVQTLICQRPKPVSSPVHKGALLSAEDLVPRAPSLTDSQ